MLSESEPSPPVVLRERNTAVVAAQPVRFPSGGIKAHHVVPSLKAYTCLFISLGLATEKKQEALWMRNRGSTGAKL